MTDDQLDQLGRISDRADNYTHAVKLALPPAIHVTALSDGMASIRDELRALYIEMSGQNPWED